MNQPPDSTEASVLVTEAATVTLIDGTTFCVCAHSGDITPGGNHGLYFRDTRVLSRWELTLDGRRVETLSSQPVDACATRFIARRSKTAQGDDASLLLVRERLVGNGLRETITIQNLGPRPVTAALAIHAQADFAEPFGLDADHSTTHEPAKVTIADGTLLLRHRTDPSRGLSLTADTASDLTPDGLTWQIEVPARGTWTTEIVGLPIVDDKPVQPRFHRGEPISRTAAVRTLSTWRDNSTSLAADDSRLALTLTRTRSDLGALRIEDRAHGRAFVAAGAPWFMALFGRDSLLTSWMALPLDLDLAIGTLQALAAVQGRRTDPFTEEEPGRIMHELRLGSHSTAIAGQRYYGSVDATPLFVMLLAEAWRWGADETTVRALLPAADAALDWVRDYGDRDGDGFVEYQRTSERGLPHQGWKDVDGSINNAQGEPGQTPIAVAEVQGYVYAALLGRAELATAFGDEATAHSCRQRAETLRQRFNEQYWLPDRGWYAVALDGHKQPMDALASNLGHCLWTGIVDDEHAEQLIAHLGSTEMDSGFGLRTLATSMGAYNPMTYHNGSVWPHDTALCVAGLMRYARIPGAVETAHRLADGLLDAAAAFGGRLPELFCGFPREQYTPPVPYPTGCSPQAWASGAPLLLLRAFLGLDPHIPTGRITLTPRLPARWGTVHLDGLRLGPARLHLSATGDTAELHGTPTDWTVDIQQQV
ncbi:amylo-alpha-1,6-glucosidase [Streptomyces adelaidensis]|uniref:amylo-alpha-1,6-glucosidase n=1 Tax=Streptomyces adelaidensis TaxID=2796465 RepID=UPI001908AFA6|nr:glycogen debranching N-terminal domain-containing protein [Streptomyces adelaidensis]